MHLHILVVADAGGHNGAGVLEGFEISQLVAAAATTLAAAMGAIPVVTAAVASLTLLLTGLRLVFGFREKWATRTWALVRIEHETNLYQLSRAHGGDAAGRNLVMQVDAIDAEGTNGWAERSLTVAAGGMAAVFGASRTSVTPPREHS